MLRTTGLHAASSTPGLSLSSQHLGFGPPKAPGVEKNVALTSKCPELKLGPVFQMLWGGLCQALGPSCATDTSTSHSAYTAAV